MKLTTPTPLKIAKYQGVKITCQINAIMHSTIFKHLKLSQQNAVSTIRNRYGKNGYIELADTNLLWKYFNNFVLNDFRYTKTT